MGGRRDVTVGSAFPVLLSAQWTRVDVRGCTSGVLVHT